MKDEHDTDTSELFPEKPKHLKKSKGGFQRLHIEKITASGHKKTTISIDDYSYMFLSDKLGEEPFTREANKAIKAWINHKMKTDLTYDRYASYNFSTWLKKIILLKIVDAKLRKKFMDKYIFLLSDL